MPPAPLPRSRLSKLQVGASLAGGGAWTPVFLAGDGLEVQEASAQSTRRRKSAALGSPTGGSPTARRGHQGPFPAWGQVERHGPTTGRGDAWTRSALAAAAAPRALTCPVAAAPGRPRELARGPRRGAAGAEAAARQSQVSARPPPAGSSSSSRFPSRRPSCAPGGRRRERGAERGTPLRFPPSARRAPSRRVSRGHVSGGQVQRPQTCPPEPGGPGLRAARALTQVSAGPGAAARPPCVPGGRPRGGGGRLALGGLAEVSRGFLAARCSRRRGAGTRSQPFLNRMLWTPASRRWESGPTRVRLTHPPPENTALYLK